MLRRLFFGLELSDEARRIVKTAADALQLEKGARSEAANYHITLAFLGMTDEKALPLLRQLAFLAWEAPLNVRLSGEMGSFKGGSVLWAGVGRDEALIRFQKRLHDILQENGFVGDKDGYTPHITVARSARALMPYPPVTPASWTVSGITLFESLREDGQLFYKPLYRISHDDA